MNSGESDHSIYCVRGSEEMSVGADAELPTSNFLSDDLASTPTNSSCRNVDDTEQKLEVAGTLLDVKQLSTLADLLRSSGGITPEALEKQLTPLLTQTPCGSCPASPHVLDQLDDLKQVLNQHFLSKGDLRFLNLTIQCQEKLIAWTPKQDEAYAGRLGTLGSFYASRFTCSGDLDDLRQAIEHEKLGISLTPINDPYEANRLGNLGMSYTQLYQATGRVEDIDNAIKTYERVVSLTPSQHPNIHGRLVGLGIAYQNRFMQLGRMADINAAIKLQEQAVSLLSDRHKGMVYCLINLGISYRCCYEKTKQRKYADLAVHSHSKARSLTLSSAGDFPNVLSNLGSSYRARFDSSGDVNDINKSIESHTEAITIVSVRTSKAPPMYLQNLGASYFGRFERLGQIQDLDMSIEFRSKAVSMSIEGDPSMADRLAGLGVTHSFRFRLLGEVEDLEKATECYLRAVSMTPRDHLNFPDQLGNLANAYEDRFNRFGQMNDLQKAIDYHSEALSQVPEGDTRTSNRLSSLGNCYTERFDRAGNLEDLERAIELQTQSVALAMEDEISLPLKKMNLAIVLNHRFSRLGQLCDIDQAIQLQMHAISSLPLDHPSLIPLFGSLAISHKHRFNRLQQSYDINRAVELSEQALKLTPDNHSDMPERLYDLGSTYSDRFSRQGDYHDLELAIMHISRAVELTQNDHPRMAMQLAVLGNNHACRFEQLGQLENADKALECHSKALSLTPNDHIDYPGFLNNLGLTHYYKYRQYGDKEDIEKAIEHQTHAITLVPDGDTNIPSYCSNLAWANLIRFQKLGDLKSLTSSLEYFEKSAQSFAGQPWRRIDDAYTWAQHIPVNLIKERLRAYQTVVDIIPELVWVGTTITQRYKNIHRIGNMALEAAALAIQAQDYYLALEWLEQGRSVVWNQVLQLRTPLHDLAAVDPELAEKLQQVAEELYSSSSKNITTITSYGQRGIEQFSRNQHRLAEKYKDLLDEARRLPGFESFLKPKMGSELVHAARTGPLIVLNIHESRCDALVLTPGNEKIIHVSLPSLSHVKMQGAWAAIQHSLDRRDTKQRGGVRRPFADEDDDDEFESILADLWIGVAKPIIDVLGLNVADTIEELTHITWCVTGPLSFLPLHAAGFYDHNGAKLSDYAVSSYIPTLSALFSNDNDTLESGTGLSILGVGQEATAGHAPLPHTTSELNHIKQRIKPPHTFTEITGQSATTGAVLDLIQDHDWIHLACHAHQNVINPTESGTFLHDGILSVAAITERRFKKKGLAFLSACQTATGDQKLADESVHLASAMLAAGYSSVIATMWSIADADGPVISDKFYEQVMKNNQKNERTTAEALYVAVRHLKNTVGEKCFRRWVPFVHYGK